MLKNDLTGKRFGKLTVVEYLGRKHHSSFWRCKCDCGNEVNCYYGNLIRGTSTSCGCMRSAYAKQSRIRAGWTPEECLFGKEKKTGNSMKRMEIPSYLKNHC